MTELINTFQERYSDWVSALIEHLQLSLLSLLIAILIALPLGMILYRKDRASELALQGTGVLQTIPSLALLGLLIPLVGIGTLPSIIALVLYAVFPILQATITGLRGVDPSLIEAGTAFGMTRWERLKTFELPLAMPVIVSGIRTSAVMIIGTATLAALIGAGGLGTFITLGIDRSNSALILIGAISAALLAIAFNIGLKILERSKIKTVLISLAVLFLGAFIPSVWPMSSQQDTIVIAGKLGAEPDILIHMYQELIEQDTDMSVELKSNFGKTDFLYQALKSGNIDIYPEFTGTVTSSLLKSPPSSSTDAKKVYQQARDGIKQQDDLDYLKPMAYQNTYALAVRKDFAKEQNLSQISDLAKVQNQLTAGFSPEFTDRSDGYPGLEKLYQLSFNYKSMEPSLRYQAIKNKEVNLIDVYSTDSQIKQYKLKVLEDDKHLFPPYQGAPLLRKGLLKEHPELEETLNKLSGKITAEEMTEMNYQVDVKGKSAKAVAHDYLAKEGLIKEKD